MISIRCPNCETFQFLELSPNEDFLGYIEPGTPKRIVLQCPGCGEEFLLQATLSQIITERG